MIDNAKEVMSDLESDGASELRGKYEHEWHVVWKI